MTTCVRYLMSAMVLLTLASSAAGQFQSSEEEQPLRRFRDQRGRTMQARVLSVQGNQATIQRIDGAKFTVPFSLFSREDQAYLRRWKQPSESASSLPAATNGADADDVWSCFRGPNGMGVATATDLPLEWTGERNVVWKARLPGSGASSPIVWEDRIYLTCYSGYFVPGEPGGSLEDLKRHLLALRRDTGEVLWERTVPAKLPEERSIRDHGYAANTPVADESGVIVFFGKSGVHAYDHAGNPRWQADVGDGTHGWGTAASPVLYQDLVIINASVESQSLIALNRKTGKVAWRAADIREAWNTPILVKADSGREELVVARHGDVLAFAPRTGKPLWSCKTDITWYMVPSGVAADGIVYYFGGRSGTAALAVRAGGNGDVTNTHRLWTSPKGSNVTSPIYRDGHLYWMHEQLGIAYCAKADTGELLYEERLPQSGQVYASPILANGRLYYVTRGGRTFVLAAEPRFSQLAVNDLDDGSRFDACPAVDGQRLLIRSEKYLYCLGQ